MAASSAKDGPPKNRLSAPDVWAERNATMGRSGAANEVIPTLVGDVKRHKQPVGYKPDAPPWLI